LREWVGVFQIRLNRRYDDASFNRDEVDADQRYANPCVDDDALVENVIEHVNHARAGCRSFRDQGWMT
jgi:hypothetical protein